MDANRVRLDWFRPVAPSARHEAALNRRQLLTAAGRCERLPHQEVSPHRLFTAFEVAEFVGCHEETVRRAYLRGLLTSQRFGVRSRRFHRENVLDWIRRGAPTKVS
jgi:excisionase family DNA binding protein